MKAAMVVTGGLSGGISSTIAGGKFMDGFRQGLITNGLNHTAHAVAQSFDRSNYKKLYKQVEDAMGSAAAKFSGDLSDLLKLMQDVPILRELYNKLDGTKIWAVVLKNHPDASKYAGMAESNTDGSISIKIFHKKSNSNIDVALTLGHELTHAIGKVNGSEVMWASMIRRDAGSKMIKNYVTHQSEVGAYMWSVSYADSVCRQKNLDFSLDSVFNI